MLTGCREVLKLCDGTATSRTSRRSIVCFRKRRKIANPEQLSEGGWFTCRPWIKLANFISILSLKTIQFLLESVDFDMLITIMFGKIMCSIHTRSHTPTHSSLKSVSVGSLSCTSDPKRVC